MKKVVCFRVKTITLQYPYILKLNQINFSHHRDSNIMQTVKYNSITYVHKVVDPVQKMFY